MLADSVEAASRSLKVHKEENLKRVITEIFDNYLQDGQLDDCDFSLRELRAIAASFLATLYDHLPAPDRVSRFRLRDEEERTNRRRTARRTNNDRDPQPPEKVTGLTADRFERLLEAAVRHYGSSRPSSRWPSSDDPRSAS